MVLFAEKILIFHVKENNNLILKNKLIRKEKKTIDSPLKLNGRSPMTQTQRHSISRDITRHHKVFMCRYNKTATTDVNVFLFLNKYTYYIQKSYDINTEKL